MSEQSFGFVIDGKHFYVEIDFASILELIDELYAESDIDLEKEDGNAISQDDYEADLRQMKTDIQALVENPSLLIEVVKSIGFKKNGWLRIGGICYYKKYENTSWLDEESYGFRKYVLKGKALNDSRAKLTLMEDIFKW